ncbi:MAG: hypothetical protein ACFB0C_10690 [Leptolyngbyaceae cyanobacterium]
MSNWLTIGTIIPGIENFTPWGPPVQGGELFRVTQSWADAFPGYGYAHIVQRWPEGTYTWDRIYPSDQPSLLRLPIPPEFRAGDLLTRAIEGRLSRRARIPVTANWALTLEVWIGPTLTTGTPTTGGAIATPTSGPISPVINTDPGLYGVISNDPGTYDP